MNNQSKPNPDQEPNDPLLMDHEYDGIRELDNKLPRWWVWLFNLCIVFAIIYMIYYHGLGKGRLMAAEYEHEMKIGNEIKLRAVAEFEQRMGTLQPSTDAKMLAEGRETFEKLCAPCHAPDGGGIVGPNLTDTYWIHGSNFVDNLKIIWDGVPAKGMVTWRGVLKPGTIHAVGSYIYTLRGTTPKNPKPPENMVKAPTGPSEFE